MISFTYTKTSGEVSERVGLVVNKPQTNWSILDLSELSKDERLRVEEAYADYARATKTLFKEFGLDKYFKYFKEEGISKVREV